jgi:hypothetical protein
MRCKYVVHSLNAYAQHSIMTRNAREHVLYIFTEKKKLRE